MNAEGPAIERDPANDLYDRACTLLVEASELQHAAARQGNEAAIVATLGCLESVLAELAETYRLLQRTTSRHPRLHGADLARCFDDLVHGVEHARSASEKVRALAGPPLAELPLR